MDWQQGGGHREYVQPRNLGPAILHRGGDEQILFVLNHYPDAVRFRLTFGADSAITGLVNVDDGIRPPVNGAAAIVDVDRKSGAVYCVETR